MAFDQISTSVTIISSGLLGYQAISLSPIGDASATTVITAGSCVEIASAFFKASTDITPGATSWTAITTGATAYITLTPSGSAGTQILTADWSSTAPTWSTSKQGWYASTASSVRYVGAAYKDGASTWSRIATLPVVSQRTISFDGTTRQACKVVNIGDWDMDANDIPASSTVAHGLPFTSIITLQVWIRDDSNTYWRELSQANLSVGTAQPGHYYVQSDAVVLRRLGTGIFDNTSYDSTSFNRGYVVIWYIV